MGGVGELERLVGGIVGAKRGKLGGGLGKKKLARTGRCEEGESRDDR